MDQLIEYGVSERVSEKEDTIFFNGMNLDPDAKNYSNCDIVGSFYEVEQNKGSFTAVGYEQDENIVYTLIEPMSKDDILKCEWLKSRTIPKGNYFNFSCLVDRYFDTTRFKSEDTVYRVLFKLDGVVLVRGLYGDATTIPLIK